MADLKGYALGVQPPFSSSRLPFGGLVGSSILAPCVTILTLREHPGGLFWHLGTNLQDHWSSRRGPQQDFSRFWNDCWTFFKVLLAPRLEIPICFRACFQVIFIDF